MTTNSTSEFDAGLAEGISRTALKAAGVFCFKCEKGDKPTFEKGLVDAVNHSPSKKQHWAHHIGSVKGIGDRVFSSCQANQIWNAATGSSSEAKKEQPQDAVDHLMVKVGTDGVADLISKVLDDEESRPGGWGPDVTCVTYLHEAYELLTGKKHQRRAR